MVTFVPKLFPLLLIYNNYLFVLDESFVNKIDEIKSPNPCQPLLKTKSDVS